MYITIVVLYGLVGLIVGASVFSENWVKHGFLALGIGLMAALFWFPLGVSLVVLEQFDKESK